MDVHLLYITRQNNSTENHRHMNMCRYILYAVLVEDSYNRRESQKPYPYGAREILQQLLWKHNLPIGFQLESAQTLLSLVLFSQRYYNLLFG
jgi:hypothetical protein